MGGTYILSQFDISLEHIGGGFFLVKGGGFKLLVMMSVKDLLNLN
jgi:hypothetical protein